MALRFVTRLLLAAVVLLGTTHLSSAEPLPHSIRFGSYGGGFGQPYGLGILAIAQLKGFVADEFKGTPVTFDWNYFTNNGPAVNEAIASGQIDFAQYGALPNIIGIANGLPIKIVMSYGTGNLFLVVRKDLPVQSVKELKGRRIAVQKGTVLHLELLRLLQENGLTERDVTLVDLKDPDQPSALSAGSVDAIYGTSSLLALSNQNVARVIYSANAGDPRTGHFGAFVATDTFLKTYPGATERVVQGLIKAAYWASQEKNREEVLRLWSKSGVPYAALKEEFAGQPLRNQLDPLIDPYFLDRYREAIAFSKEQRLIRRDIDIAAWLEPKYLATGLKALGLESYWTPHSANGAATAAEATR